jgi:hypothetical protein
MSAFGHLGATVRRRPPSFAVLVGLPLLAGLLGVILALAFASKHENAPPGAGAPSPRRIVAAGDLRFTLPHGWTQASPGPDVPGFGGAHALFARSLSADVVIALLPAVRPSLLPRALDAMKSPTSSRPTVIRAGALQGYHYVRAAKGQRVLELVVAPTTHGIATIACSSAVAAPGECDQALGGLALAHGEFLPLNADAAFLARLPAVTATLDERRFGQRTRLARAARAENAVSAASRLAAAYAEAGRVLRPLAPAHGDAAATSRLLDDLRDRYGRLADALRIGDRVAFAATARAIRRDEARLASRLAALQRVLALPGSGPR